MPGTDCKLPPLADVGCLHISIPAKLGCLQILAPAEAGSLQRPAPAELGSAVRVILPNVPRL